MKEQQCKRARGQEGAGIVHPLSHGRHETGATSPKIYWHDISGSRKAKGTREHREGRNLTSPLVHNPVPFHAPALLLEAALCGR